MKSTIILLLALAVLNSCSDEKKEPPLTEVGHESVGESIDPVQTDSAVRNTDTYHTIVIRQMEFSPAELRVNKGDTVAWINQDITEHDITELNEEKWSSSKLPAGTRWSMVVSEAADYYCSIHVVMKGKLIIE